MCVLHYINGVNSRTRQQIAVPISTREPKQTVNQSVATSHKKTVATDSTVKKPRNIIRKIYEQVIKTCSWWYPKFTPSGYKWKPKSPTGNVDPNVSMPLGNASRTANILEPMSPRCSTLSNTPLSSNSFAARTVKFGNDQITPILGYGDLVQGTITIKRVYYVEGLNHNLFSVGQFCDADLEVAFRKSTCYIRDLKGNDLLTGSRGTDLSYLHAVVESLQAVETLQWENILTVRSSSNSGNHSTNSGNPLAFYSQQKKFDFLSIRIASTPIESNKSLVIYEDGVDVDVHVYMSMIGSLMYLTASRPDIMFVVCACARFQV
ncbi:hypothetical protein Tco_0686218, partial [Tanacetum coccineum]